MAARYLPNHIVVDQTQRILGRSPGAARFLRGGGAAGMVLDVIHGSLRDVLAPLLHDATHGSLPARGHGAMPDGLALEIVVERLSQDAAAPDAWVILFLEIPHAPPAPRREPRPDGGRFRRVTDLVPGGVDLPHP